MNKKYAILYTAMLYSMISHANPQSTETISRLICKEFVQERLAYTNREPAYKDDSLAEKLFGKYSIINPSVKLDDVTIEMLGKQQNDTILLKTQIEGCGEDFIMTAPLVKHEQNLLKHRLIRAFNNSHREQANRGVLKIDENTKCFKLKQVKQTIGQFLDREQIVAPNRYVLTMITYVSPQEFEEFSELSKASSDKK